MLPWHEATIAGTTGALCVVRGGGAARTRTRTHTHTHTHIHAHTRTHAHTHTHAHAHAHTVVTDSATELTMRPQPHDSEVQFILDAIAEYLTVEAR